ncbi:MAG TPA: hypothetical protein EYP62_06125 [Kiritimatiellae bacterium]|nr:hypothetical protein [Kiritimatiellia bacterium]
MRALKFTAAILLVPLCVAATRAVIHLLFFLQTAVHDNLPGGWFIGGFLFWLLLYLAMPPPTRTYILAHELTHALWTWFMGGEVRHIRVGKRSGSVRVTRDNVFISLAPYFFPLYTVLAVICWYALSLFWDLDHYRPFWMATVGLTWSFHLTFTVDLLRRRQSDLAPHGRLFSICVIYLLNVLGLGLWIVAVSRITLPQFFTTLGQATQAAYQVIGDAAAIALRRASLSR